MRFRRQALGCAFLLLVAIAVAPTVVTGQVAEPDLTGLSLEERSMIESACCNEGILNGPSAYYRCVANQLTALRGVTRQR